MALIVHLLPALSDNYIYLLQADDGKTVGLVDPGDAAVAIKALERRDLTLTHILITHHHHDHVGGNATLKERYNPIIIGPKAEQDKIPTLDRTVSEGDRFDVGGHRVSVIDTPGHTAGHIAFHFDQDQVLFAGDTLFALGCGRLFEGTARQMWDSLTKLRALPDDTQIYCGHEYTLSNAKFARSLDPDNMALRDRAQLVEGQRARNLATLPTTIGAERATNPFLRADDPGLQAHLDMAGQPAEAVFAEIRRRKDAA